jgi:prepilin-type N-terminal cleavage/methylation domain-containing protein
MTSATGSKTALGLRAPRKRLVSSGSRGFTLLELVVVLVIVGVVFASAVLVLPLSTVGPGARELETFAKQVEHARDRALFDTRPRGLGIWHGGYVFFSWHPERGWVAADDPGGRGSVSFQSATVADLSAAGRPITVSNETVADPQVIFMPSGEVTALEARIAGLSGIDYLFSTDALGDVRYSTR